jgi:hypothetical protein
MTYTRIQYDLDKKQKKLTTDVNYTCAYKVFFSKSHDQ